MSAMEYADNRSPGRETFNTAVGYEALKGSVAPSQNTGRYNTAVGDNALGMITSGNGNTGIGYRAGEVMAGGGYNSILGYQAGIVTTADRNTFLGCETGYANNSGTRNTFTGHQAGYGNTSGNYNTFIGGISGNMITTGSNNTAIGYDADFSANNLTNSTVIGANAQADANNQIRIGDNNINTFYCMGAYSGTVGGTNRDLFADNTGKIGYVSSSRYKEQILDMENVEWLFKLRPVNFFYKSDEQKMKQYGLIAEEVEMVNPLLVNYNKDGQVETVSYSRLITPMIRAMQDQQKTIATLQSQIDDLRKDQEEVLRTQELLLSRLEALEKNSKELTQK